MAKTLRLSPDLTLPLDFATEGVVAVGMRGSGKSNTLVRWFEVLYGARIPVVAIDPKGDWYGIRSSADGKEAGLSVPVFGGLYGDAPLNEGDGIEIANLLVDLNISAVLDVSLLTKAARVRFLTDFCHQLMDRHQREPHVRCVIFEEAHRYIPQQVPGPVAALKEATAAILLEGRSWGLGCWAATQRPARLNKDVLEEVGTVVLHRIGAAATNDQRTIAGWVRHEALSEEIVPSMTALRNGEAWILSPGTLGEAKRVMIDRRRTFDTGATPMVGTKVRRMMTLADLDMDAIRAGLAESIEKAKAEDPKLLQKRIRDLEAAVQAAEQRATDIGRLTPAEVEVKVPIVPTDVPPLLDLAVAVLAKVEKGLDDARLAAEDVRSAVVEAGASLDRVPQIQMTPPKAKPKSDIVVPPLRVTIPGPPPRPLPGPAVPVPDDLAGELGKGELKVLAVLGEYPEGRTMGEVAFLAGYSQRASTCGNVVAKLRRLGLVELGQPVRLTAAGAAIAPAPEKLTGDDLWRKWMDHKRVGDGERKVLVALRSAWPDQVTHEELCAMANYSPDASTCGNVVSKLRKLGLVDKQVRRLESHFAEALGL